MDRPVERAIVVPRAREVNQGSRLANDTRQHCLGQAYRGDVCSVSGAAKRDFSGARAHAEDRPSGSSRGAPYRRPVGKPNKLRKESVDLAPSPEEPTDVRASVIQR